MLKRLIARILEARHPWRYLGFDELSELYTSTMLRSMGLSVVGIFVPIYLYNLGHTVSSVCFFMATVFFSRIFFEFVAGFTVARIGPKHTILLSNLLQIVSLALLLTISQIHTPLWLIALVMGAALSFFFLAYHVDFSKIMHKDHGGKELGYMTVLERIGAAAGPVVGGMIATFFGAEYTILAAIVLFMVSTLPLFLSQEPTRTHQHLSFRGLPIRKLRRDAVSYLALGLDNTLSVAVWPFFAALTILTVNTYANVGIVTSLGIVAAILSASFIGRVIDRDKGLILFRWSVCANTVLHLLRPFAGSFGGVLLINIVNEAVSTGYKMPYFKGMYARADELPGFRIVYMIYMEALLDLAKCAVWFSIALLCLVTTPYYAMSTVFIAVGVLSLGMLSQRYPTLARQRFPRP